MEKELLEAISTIVNYCYDQDNCNRCPLKEICGKIPAEWEV